MGSLYLRHEAAHAAVNRMGKKFAHPTGAFLCDFSRFLHENSLSYNS